METLLTQYKRGSSLPTPNVPYPPPGMTLQKDILLRSIKIIDIGYITIIYFMLAFYLSIWVDAKLGDFDKEKAASKSTFRLTLESIFHIYLIGVLIYIMRNLVEKIPFPLDGVQGFIHLKVKELTNAAVFTFIFILYQKHLRAKLEYIRERMFKKNTKETNLSPEISSL